MMEKVSKYIVNHMDKAELVSQQTLDAIEEQWTGQSRVSRVPLDRVVLYHTAITSRTYLSENWHQIRELHVIPVAKNAWEMVHRASKYARNKKPISRGQFDEKVLLNAIKKLKACSPRDILLAAVMREECDSPSQTKSLYNWLKTGRALATSFILFIRHSGRENETLRTHSSGSPRNLSSCIWLNITKDPF
jgi:hypothetical protein